MQTFVEWSLTIIFWVGVFCILWVATFLVKNHRQKKSVLPYDGGCLHSPRTCVQCDKRRTFVKHHQYQ